MLGIIYPPYASTSRVSRRFHTVCLRTVSTTDQARSFECSPRNHRAIIQLSRNFPPPPPNFENGWGPSRLHRDFLNSTDHFSTILKHYFFSNRMNDEKSTIGYSDVLSSRRSNFTSVWYLQRFLKFCEIKSEDQNVGAPRGSKYSRRNRRQIDGIRILRVTYENSVF